MNSTGLLVGLNKFSIDSARKRGSSPKFQVYNQALMTSGLPSDFITTFNNKKLWGRVVESAVGAHLLAYTSNELQVYYWNESQSEVDFIIQYKGDYIAI